MTVPVRSQREVSTTVLGMVLCLALTGGLVCLYLWTDRRHSLALLFAVGVPALWAVPFVVRIRRLVATRHFVRSELLLETARPGLGQALRAQLTVVARRNVKLQGCRLVLRAVETVRLKRRRVRSAEVARVETAISTPGLLAKDHQETFETQVTVPQDVMESFDGRRASLRWELEAWAVLSERLVIPLNRQELVVKPVRTGTPAASPPSVCAGERLKLTLRPGTLQVGSRVRLEVTADASLAGPGTSVAVSAGWSCRVEGIAEVEEHGVFAGSAGDLAPGGAHPFEFLVPPAGPMSYEGKLFGITWTGRATVTGADGATLESTELPLTVGPRPA